MEMVLMIVQQVIVFVLLVTLVNFANILHVPTIAQDKVLVFEVHVLAIKILQILTAAANLWEFVSTTEPSTAQRDIVIALQTLPEISVRHQFALEVEIVMATVCVFSVSAFAA